MKPKKKKIVKQVEEELDVEEGSVADALIEGLASLLDDDDDDSSTDSDSSDDSDSDDDFGGGDFGGGGASSDW